LAKGNQRTDDTDTHRCNPIRVFEYTQRPIPIQVLRALVSQPLVSLDMAGCLENAAYMQWVAHADHLKQTNLRAHSVL